jgi:redox-sensitive bicupin YhaK (pirin superfamily)
MSAIDVRPAAGRFHTRIDWLDSWHSFSFGEFYDPANTHHGLLRVSNDDVVAPGQGFAMHPHRDMEIVTWVLEGSLEHRDTEGNVGLITRNVAQRMSAGTGIRHSETNASTTEPVHLLQMWVPPDTPGIPPGYEQQDVGDRFEADKLFALASGREAGAAIQIHQRDATLWVARLGRDRQVTLPAAPFVHVFVAEGSAELPGAAPLGTGDAARLTDAGAIDATAGDDGAHLVVWEMYSTLA